MASQQAQHEPSGLKIFQTSSVPTVQLGRTRCYWCILTPSLDFAFLDPVLHTHLGAESKMFIGTNLLDYIHPDERDALGNDLLPKLGANGGIEASGVFGSITRCRYSRLPRIRRLLGCSSPETDPDAAKYVSDDLFLPLAITTSWIGGGDVQHDAHSGVQLKGAVLAFFHATEDKDEEKDNDEVSPSSWTNWCGPRVEDGPYLDQRRCQQMVQALSWATGIDPMRPPDGPYPPQHVFQILDHRGHILVSFPNTGDRYGAEEYAALARTVSNDFKTSSEDRTSCTRRYRSKHPIMKAGSLATVESVVIRYRAITFACFETGGVYFSNAQSQPANGSFTLEDVPKLSSPEKRSPPFHFGHSEDARDTKRGRFLSANGEVPALTISTSAPLLQPPNHAYSDLQANGGVSPTVASASAILGSFSHQAHEQAPSYQPHPAQQQQQQHSPHESKAMLELPVSRPGAPHSTTSPSYALPPKPQGYSLPSLPVPGSSFPAYPPHPLAQPAPSMSHQGHDAHTPTPSTSAAVSYSAATASAPHYPTTESHVSPNGDATNGSKSPTTMSAQEKADLEKAKRKARRELSKSKNGPAACQSCGIINSPEWRKGPDGTKSLCNACGLRYARSVAKQNKQPDTEQTGSVPKKRGRGKGKKTLKEEAAAAAAAASPGSGTAPDQNDHDQATSDHAEAPQKHPLPSMPVSSAPMATPSYPAAYFNGAQHHMHAPPYGGLPPHQQQQQSHLSSAYRLPQIAPPQAHDSRQRHPSAPEQAYGGHAPVMDYHHPHSYMHDSSLQHHHHQAALNGYSHPATPHLWLPPNHAQQQQQQQQQPYPPHHNGHQVPYGVWSGVPPHPHAASGFGGPPPPSSPPRQN
ncbi:hypothetical protein ACM66B_004053 [Microbotryomycetes sp. NB124-2]